MRLSRLVVVGLVGLIGFAANFATAQEAGVPASIAVDGVDLVDPNALLEERRLSVRWGAAPADRFAALDDYDRRRPGDQDTRRSYEFAFTAQASDELGVAFAPRAGLSVNRDGDIAGRSSGAELRLGRLMSSRDGARAREPSWYIFAASEDEALTWRPGVRNEFGSVGPAFGLEERVDIGDLQAGVTYERDGWQTSLAYVEREYSIRSGARTQRREESFTGITWTMRH